MTEIWNIILSVLSFILALLSIVFVIITLKQKAQSQNLWDLGFRT